jgi:hypothetical protein
MHILGAGIEVMLMQACASDSLHPADTHLGRIAKSVSETVAPIVDPGKLDRSLVEDHPLDLASPRVDGPTIQSCRDVRIWLSFHKVSFVSQGVEAYPTVGQIVGVHMVKDVAGIDCAPDDVVCTTFAR